MRWQSRDSRSMAVASTSGSPRSRPSEQITTIPPRLSPPRAQSRTNRSSEAPIRVPPSQSVTARRGAVERLVGPAAVQLAGHPGQPGPEAEDLDAGGGAGRGVRELDQVARVVRHRARHVQDEASAAAAGSGGGAGRARRARRAGAWSRGRCVARRGSGRDAAGTRTPGAPARRGQPHGPQDPPQRGELLGRARGERLVRGDRDVGGHQAEPGLLLLAAPRRAPRSPAPPGRPGPRRAPGRRLLGGRSSSRRRRGSSARRAGGRPGSGRAGSTSVRAAGPVEVDQVGRVERGDRPRVGEHVAGADGEPRRPAARGRSRPAWRRTARPAGRGALRHPR